LRQAGSNERPSGHYDDDRRVWIGGEGQPSYRMRGYQYTVSNNQLDDQTG